jgi:hypothetical protein
MNCHMQMVMLVLGLASLVVGGIVAISYVTAWLDYRYGQLAAWAFLGVVFIVFLISVAWYIPCSEAL